MLSQFEVVEIVFLISLLLLPLIKNTSADGSVKGSYTIHIFQAIGDYENPY